MHIDYAGEPELDDLPATAYAVDPQTSVERPRPSSPAILKLIHSDAAKLQPESAQQPAEGCCNCGKHCSG